ncbi:lysozyme inhibitor LprI family protein [Desulfovibrio intestinalis]|uniref:Uncharacterized protein YecT (DUF1311 family) n=1 Tax=Desulfovibrio intestinalis TaxID=58621 RepID=A0A7W8C1L3_9BACT|nr:lysozyme inhibitor LprI family protein [Desulfovibrio intestinalis]MBB5143173.1 uncharacterized protein YecT (DUF1311 family) [Desulfovibrio intestinalis]
MNKAAGVTDSILQCIQQATDIWDKLRTATTKPQLVSLESEQDRGALKAAQLAWIAWRDKMAAALLAFDGGGNLSTLSTNFFIMEETQLQADRLKVQP